MSSLTDAIIGKFPGAYDHLDPADIEQAVIKQYPGAYDHMTEHIDTLNKDSNKPKSTLENAIDFISNAYNKDPSKESNVLPDFKQPETFTGGFAKSLYDQYLKPLGTIPGMAEGIAGLAAGGIHDVPSAPTMRPSDAIARQAEAARTAKPNLPPEFAAVGDESFAPRPQFKIPGANPAVVNDSNYFRLGQRDVYPSSTSSIAQPSLDEARQGLMSEFGGLGSDGRPPFPETQTMLPETRNLYLNKKLTDSLKETRDILDEQERKNKDFYNFGKKNIITDESGQLGSGGAPKSEDYLQAQQFFKDQGKQIPKNIENKATDIKYNENTGLFHAKDTKGKPVGAFDEQGNPLETPEEKTGSNPTTDFLTKAANTSGQFAKSVLGLHIPGTALSFHGMNELVRDSLFGGNILTAPKRAFEDLTMLVNPGKASKILENIPMQKMADMVNKGGVQMDISDVDVPSLFKGTNLFTKGYNWMTDPKPLFKQVIPAMKVKTYDKYFQQLTDSGIGENEAHKVAGNFVNNIFGGVTPEGLSADPTFRKLSRIAMLAPDWMTSNYRLGKGVAQTLANPLDPRNRAYANGMMNFAAAYGAANILNHHNTGKFMWQNEPGKELSIAMGSVDRPDGKKATRYIEPFGTAADFIRLPVAVAHSAISGDPGASFKLIGSLARNRLSPPLAAGSDLMFNQDYSGKPLYGKSKFGRHTIGYGEEAQNIGSDILSHVLPIGAEGALDYAQGKISPEEAAAKFLQIPPMSYRKPAKGYREQDQ